MLTSSHNFFFRLRTKREKPPTINHDINSEAYCIFLRFSFTETPATKIPRPMNHCPNAYSIPNRFWDRFRQGISWSGMDRSWDFWCHDRHFFIYVGLNIGSALCLCVSAGLDVWWPGKHPKVSRVLTRLWWFFRATGVKTFESPR